MNLVMDEKKEVKKIAEQVKFIALLSSRLEEDILSQLAKEEEKKVYSVKNGEAYANDIVRIRRELNNLRKMIIWRSGV